MSLVWDEIELFVIEIIKIRVLTYDSGSWPNGAIFGGVRNFMVLFYWGIQYSHKIAQYMGFWKFLERISDSNENQLFNNESYIC